ncbi:hypothetical protein FN846DRAFT_718547 [Sphaerosporella brunnea]|uniref:Ankyrin repeat-containing domain protein n=1 Tax=Sphaerosporella brunnea TaxID=1250544 RepID=A0A5J5EYF6_9PEZI|nr:hypothetical protein FN846DRAFT_718547 [Sphaerosporella brunnea]
MLPIVPNHQSPTNQTNQPTMALQTIKRNGFLGLHVEIHMEIAEHLSDLDGINIALACARSDIAFHAYVRELQLRDAREALGGPDRLKMLVRWAYDSLHGLSLQKLARALPPRAFLPVMGVLRLRVLLHIPEGSSISSNVILTNEIRVLNEVEFSGNGGVALAAAEGNVAVLRIFLERWDWQHELAALPLWVACLHGHTETINFLLTAMDNALTAQQCAQLIISHPDFNDFDVLGCCVYACHDPATTTAGAAAMRKVLSYLTPFPELLHESKSQAVYFLIMVAESKVNWDPDDITSMDTILELLQPLPDNPRLHRLIQEMAWIKPPGVPGGLQRLLRLIRAFGPSKYYIAWAMEMLPKELKHAFFDFVHGFWEEEED